MNRAWRASQAAICDGCAILALLSETPGDDRKSEPWGLVLFQADARPAVLGY